MTKSQSKIDHLTVPVATHFVPRAEFEGAERLNIPAIERARIVAALARLNTLYMIKRAGSGHIGSSLSSLDIVTWLYMTEIAEGKALYFSSKGHDAPGLYAVLTGLGHLPIDMVHRLRRLGGLPGHPDIATPHIPANTGSLGMGISKAKGIAFANRQAGTHQRIYVMTGDGELQEGQLWESLGQAANAGYGEITAIVDHNKLQSDTWVRTVSDLGDLEAKFAAFSWHVERCDGHDLAALAHCLDRAKAETDRPSVIIADTVKGKGVSFMESLVMAPTQELYGYHSGAPSDADYKNAIAELTDAVNKLLTAAQAEPLRLEAAPPPEPAASAQTSPADAPRVERLPQAYAEALVEIGRQNRNVIALDGDLMLDCGLIPFRDTFPDRFLECGIAEQDMVSQAGMMALAGLVPVCHSFACFLTPRANEQIYNNATQGGKVVYCGFLAGVIPAGPGHSHQSVRDIGILSCTPGLSLIEPSCAAELVMALDWAINRNDASTYLRITSIPCEVAYDVPDDYRLEAGRGFVLREGGDAVIIAYGPVMLANAIGAAEIAAGRGIALGVVNLPWLNTLNTEWLAATIGDAKAVFTLDDHYLAGGQGEMLAAAMARAGLAAGRKVVSFGLTEIPACGTNDEVLRHHGLDAVSLAERIVETVARREEPAV